MTQKPAAVVLAGGLGTRMKSDTPKHFHRLLGRRMVDWVVAAARAVDADPLVVVSSPQGVRELDGIQTAVQSEPRGTGDALAAARPALDGVAADLLVLSGGAPLSSPDLLSELPAATRREAAAATTSPSARPIHVNTAA